MTKKIITKNSFSFGEASDQMDYRSDMELHGRAVKKMQNLYCDPRGGIRTREGLELIDVLDSGDVPGGEKVFRALPFSGYVVFDQSTPTSNLISDVVLLPGSGEFTYSTTPITKYKWEVINGVAKRTEVDRILNINTNSNLSDIEISIQNLTTNYPNVRRVSLIVSWFASSLNAGQCKVTPAVEYEFLAQPQIGGSSDISTSQQWLVLYEGQDILEGPSVSCYREYAPKIQDYAVDYDNAKTNAIVNSYGNLQLCCPKNIKYDPTNLSNPYSAEITFGGTPSDQSVREAIRLLKKYNLEVTIYPLLMVNNYNKPWRGMITGSPEEVKNFFSKDPSRNLNYRKYILHYANIAKEEKAEAIIIGSEMVGLTKVKDIDGSYPAIDELIKLSDKVRDIVGPNIKITYAADWSEYHSSEGIFNMDKLWMHNNIDYIGIDAYFPLTPGSTKESIYNTDYLEYCWEAEEGYDYYYNDSNIKDGIRNPIDPLWAWKNIRYWWSNVHPNSTWVPKSKKIWFTEWGFPSVNCSTNQPNVFYDPDSINGKFPWNSNGSIDYNAQKSAIIATIKWISKQSDMIERASLWSYDARPFPYYPKLLNIWSDGNVYPYGHWIQGKLDNQGIEKGGLILDKREYYTLILSSEKLEIYKDDQKIEEIFSSLLNLTPIQLKELKYCQQADTLILTHQDIEPIRILRISRAVPYSLYSTSKSFAIDKLPIKNKPRWAFEGIQTDFPQKAMSLTGLVGNVKISVTGGNFDNTMINQEINANDGGTSIVTKVNSLTEVMATILVPFSKTSYPSGEWYTVKGFEDAWSEKRGYPRTCIFFQNRLIFGGSKNLPDTVWFSTYNDYLNFNPGAQQATDSFDRTIINDVNIIGIRNIIASRFLVVFTTGSVWYLAQDLSTPITPSQASFQKVSSIGSALMSPVLIDGSLFYSDDQGVSIREAKYGAMDYSYITDDIAFTANHLIKNPFVCAMRPPVQKCSMSQIFFVNNDYSVSIFSSLTSAGISCWSSLQTQGEVLDVISIRNEVYFIVQRIGKNNNYVTSLEKINRACYLDAFKQIYTRNNSTLAFYNKEYAGFKINCIADNGEEFDAIIDDEGFIQMPLNTRYVYIFAGFIFERLLRTFPISLFDGEHSTCGMEQSISTITLLTKNSNNIEIQTINENNSSIKCATVQNTNKDLFQWSTPQPILNSGKDIQIIISSKNGKDFELANITINTNLTFLS